MGSASWSGNILNWFDTFRMALLGAVRRACWPSANPEYGNRGTNPADARQFQQWHRLFRRECVPIGSPAPILEAGSRRGSRDGFTRFTRFKPQLGPRSYSRRARDRAVVESANSTMRPTWRRAASKDFAAELEFARRARVQPSRRIRNSPSASSCPASPVTSRDRAIIRAGGFVALYFTYTRGRRSPDQPLVAGPGCCSMAHPVIHYADASSILRSISARTAAERSARR